MAAEFLNQPVVIDNGSGVIKAGFAGDYFPKCRFGNCVGRPKYSRVMAGALEGDSFIGTSVEEHRGLMFIKYPVENGVVTDWNDMERIWYHVYSKEQLQACSDEHPVLLTEAPLNPKRNREMSAEIFFEALNVPALFVSIQAVLSLYATGRLTGVVLDSGDGVTQAVPIYEGYSLPHSMYRIDIAGRNVTQYLQLLLRKEGINLKTSSEFEIVRAIKEKMCFFPVNAAAAYKEEMVHIDDPKMSFTLPDGTVVKIEKTALRAPEVLFNPFLIGDECYGAHAVLAHAVHKSDIDMRKDLYSNIVLSGGSTLFKGFGDRLLTEIRKICPRDVKIKISAPQDRLYSTWIGGSILASLDTFKKMWVSKREYEEQGCNIIHRKTF